jgi:hypothetical protein
MLMFVSFSFFRFAAITASIPSEYVEKDPLPPF